MCKAKMVYICERRTPQVERVTYRCSSAKQSYSAYCSKVKPDGHISHRHDGECIPDSTKYRIGSGRPPYNVYYKRCDGRYRNSHGEVLQ